MHTVFSIEESLKFGWQKTKTHSLVLFQALLTLLALEVASTIVDHVLDDTAIGALASFAIFVAWVVLGTGFIHIALKIAKGEAAVYRDIVPELEVVWNVFLASLLVGIMTVAGLILFIIPGIYLVLRFSMVRFAVLDGAGIMESITKSSKLTEGVKWKLLGFLLIYVLLNLLGAIPFGLGLLITMPVTTIAFAHVYLKLKNHAHGHTH